MATMSGKGQCRGPALVGEHHSLLVFAASDAVVYNARQG